MSTHDWGAAFRHHPILKLRKEESVGSGCLASRRFDVPASVPAQWEHYFDGSNEFARRCHPGGEECSPQVRRRLRGCGSRLQGAARLDHRSSRSERRRQDDVVQCRRWHDPPDQRPDLAGRQGRHRLSSGPARPYGPDAHVPARARSFRTDSARKPGALRQVPAGRPSGPWASPASSTRRPRRGSSRNRTPDSSPASC